MLFSEESESHTPQAEKVRDSNPYNGSILSVLTPVANWRMNSELILY